MDCFFNLLSKLYFQEVLKHLIANILVQCSTYDLARSFPVPLNTYIHVNITLCIYR